MGIHHRWGVVLCFAAVSSAALAPHELAIGVSTCQLMHASRVAHVLRSWGGRAIRRGIRLRFFSDKSEIIGGIEVTGCAGCESSVKGLPCKTGCLFRTLWAEYPDAKWYVRVMDDTLVAEENLLAFLEHRMKSRGKNINTGEKLENLNLRWEPLDSADKSVLKS